MFSAADSGKRSALRLHTETPVPSGYDAPAGEIRQQAEGPDRGSAERECYRNADAAGSRPGAAAMRAQHCDHCSRNTERIKDFLAPTALVYGIVPADKDVDAAQVESR